MLTGVSLILGLDIRTVGDMGDMGNMGKLPESLMTASLADELTDTRSGKNREYIGKGIANFGTGFIRAMAGYAMIGQSIINVKSGGRGRLSTFCAGLFLLTPDLAIFVLVSVLSSGISFAWKIA